MRPIVFVAFTIGSISMPADQWFAADKAKHFFLGAFIQSASFSGLRAAGLDRTGSLVAASAITTAAVAAKELRDRAGRGTMSFKDAAWGLAGAAAITPALARTK